MRERNSRQRGRETSIAGITKGNVRFEEVHYGLLVMIVCDVNGIVYDLWVYPASYENKIKLFEWSS